jgi:translation initiation factor 3 subunit H
MVTGSLLGLANAGTLEVTHAFPFPDSVSPDAPTGANEDDAGQDFQLEMMRMLREVNVDNNCVGWYQSMYLGSYSTSSFLENQFSYQTDLSPNAVVLLYDPLQTAHGSLVLKCFRLTQAYLDTKIAASGQIFEEVPIVLVNPGLGRALVSELQTDTTFDCLDLSTNPYLEKHLEFLCSWVDDLSQEQHKFQYWARASKRRTKSGDTGGAAPEAPKRLESLLITNQIRNYCDQMDKFAGGGFGKLFLVSGLHQKDRTGAN